MKQIVFLISAFLVLFQLYSTGTAAPTDSSSDLVAAESYWDFINEYLSERTDVVGKYIGDLKKTVESAWEEGGVDKSTTLAEYVDTFLGELAQLKKIYAAAIEIIDDSGLPNTEGITHGVEAVVDRVYKGISNITDELVATVSLTSDVREQSVEAAIQKLEEMMEIEPGQVVATLRNNGSKPTEDDAITELDLTMDAYLVKTIEHTEIMKDWLKDLAKTGIVAWTNAAHETLVYWVTGLKSVMDDLDVMEVKTWAIIDAVKASGSAPPSGYQEMIDGVMSTIKTSVDSISEQIANKTSETPEEITADVEEYVTTLSDLVEAEWDGIEAAIAS